MWAHRTLPHGDNRKAPVRNAMRKGTDYGNPGPEELAWALLGSLRWTKRRLRTST